MAYENAILVVILIGTVIFGAKKIPELARSLGRAQIEYEKARLEGQRELHSRYEDDSESGGNDDGGAGIGAVRSSTSSTSTTATTADGSSNASFPTATGRAAAEMMTGAVQGNNNSSGSAGGKAVSVLESRDSNNNNKDNSALSADIAASIKSSGDRIKLQNAAKKIGIEHSEKLSDDELRDAICNYLDL